MCYWKKITVSTLCGLLMLSLSMVENGDWQDKNKKEKEPKVIVREPKNPPPNNPPPRQPPPRPNPPRDRDKPPRNR